MSITNFTKQNLNSPDFWDNRLKEGYDLIIKSPIYVDKLKTVINELNNIDGSILDVGMGYGFVEKLIILNKFKLKLHGIDISNFAISNAKKLYKGKFIKSEINNIPFETSMFDVVLALDILEHLSSKDCLDGLREIYRIMKQTGKFIISIPLNESKIDTFKNHHLQKYDLKVISDQLDSCGFTVVKKYHLTAYKSLYKIKSLVNNYLKISKPNLLILICKKI